MNFEMALSLPLTAFGNAWLHTNHRQRSSRELAKEMAQLSDDLRVKSVQFGDARAEHNLVPATRKWLRSLRRKGARRLWIVSIPVQQELPEHLGEAFAGSNPKGILVDCEQKQELWISHWHSTRGSKYLVSYRYFPIEPPVKMKSHPVPPAIRALKHMLKRASAFAEGTQPRWCEVFARSLEKLSDRTIETHYLPPEGFSQDARRLLVGANAAHVFGGMGSWNDMGFRDERKQQEYEQISADFYEAVMDGLLIAANSFDPNLFDD